MIIEIDQNISCHSNTVWLDSKKRLVCLLVFSNPSLIKKTNPNSKKKKKKKKNSNQKTQGSVANYKLISISQMYLRNKYFN